MHIDHDHVSCGNHEHEHSHCHTHEHTHDGHTHTHEHSHEHSHSHEHPHDHAHTPLEELLALMNYMVGHNAAHARELAELADQLKAAGSDAAYEKVMSAVADFNKGNEKLSEVLADLG